MQSRREISLRLTDGSMLVVPASLSSATTYTILEQERWFEKELDFVLGWLRPGMTAIDIGANLGVYSLPIARAVGPAGMVYAYEPASEPRGLLEKSRNANGGVNLEIIADALSDAPRHGRLVFGTSSELNRLGDSPENAAPGEDVRITSLDHEDRTRFRGAPDFVKLDAEGEENRILEGGRGFFSRRSPLVMFEVRQGASVNHDLIASFRRLGYGIYRALPSMRLLVPFRRDEEIDGYELNLFAAKPERASAVASDGMLLENVAAFSPGERTRESALETIRAQAFARPFGQLLSAPIDPSYQNALAAYATWRNMELAMAERCGALHYACETLLKLCEHAASLARLSTLARLGWESGRRSVTVVALQVLGGHLKRSVRIEEPFWPASPRFDAIAPGLQWTEWFAASALELYERSKNLSSFYGASGVDLEWLCRSPYSTAEMERRRVLAAWRAGRPMAVPEKLKIAGPDNMNADLWRSGAIQNSFGV